MLAGGAYRNRNRTLFVDLETFYMSEGPETNHYGRDSHACSMIRHRNGSSYVVLAGDSLDNLGTTELLNIEQIERGWFAGPDLPDFPGIERGCYDATMVTLHYTAVLAACRTYGGSPTHHLYQLGWDEEGDLGWTMMEQALNPDAVEIGMVAMLVPDKLVECSPAK